MSGFQDKVVAITGASGAIGQATARLLAGRGAKLMLGARRIGRLNALAKEIVEAGGSAHYQALDVTLRKSMQCFIDEATAVFGRIDVIVDGAGAMPPSTPRGDIRVRVISPIDTESKPTESITEADACEQMRGDRQAMMRPDAIARAIAFAIEQPPDVDTRELEFSLRLTRFM